MTEYKKAQETLRLMDSKFEKIKKYQQTRYETVKKSRNQYHTHIDEVKTQAYT